MDAAVDDDSPCQEEAAVVVRSLDGDVDVDEWDRCWVEFQEELSLVALRRVPWPCEVEDFRRWEKPFGIQRT